MRQLMLFLFTFSSIALTGYVLMVGQELIVPFIIAIVIWFLLNTFINSIQTVRFHGRKLPYTFALVLALATAAVLFWILLGILSNNIIEVIERLPVYQTKLQALANRAFDWFEINERPNPLELFQSLDLVSVATGVAQVITTIASNAGIIFLYILFLFLEQYSFDIKLDMLIPNPEQRDSIRALLGQISMQIQSYIKIKTVFSLITAFLCYLVLRVVGVDFPGFWALLFFLLNFIPTFGSIIATLFPLVLTFIQFESITPFLIVAVALTLIQFTIGNIVEPKLLGRSINLSGLVIILSLAVWGKIWGVTGMFLCVPIMVITNIILANFPATRPVAILLSEKGDIR